MNPRAAINDLLPFQGSPFGQLGYFSSSDEYAAQIMINNEVLSSSNGLSPKTITYHNTSWQLLQQKNENRHCGLPCAHSDDTKLDCNLRFCLVKCPCMQRHLLTFVLRTQFTVSFDNRRGWDSNPRALADKRFSRPPRYDHFDTSPHRNQRFRRDYHI